MSLKDWTIQLGQKWHYKGVGWRKLAYWGASRAPEAVVKYSPDWFGVASSIVLVRERERVRENLRLLFGKRSRIEEERDITRTFVAYAHCLAESLGAERPRAQAARCTVHNEEALSLLLKEPSGFIIVTAHTGGWDVAAQVLMATSGRKVTLVMDREPDPAARALQDELRKRKGVQVAHVGADALEGLALLKHLRQGGVVAVQIDRSPRSGRCVTASLAGHPFKLPEGPFVLGALAQVPILPLFVSRRGYYDYEVRVGNAIRLPRRPEPAEVDNAARDVASLMEAFLLDHPEQWFNFLGATSAPNGNSSYPDQRTP